MRLGEIRMSSSEEDQQVVVQSGPAVVPAGSTVQVVRSQPAVVSPVVERSETVVTHSSTNTGALFATLLGVIVLVAGTALIYSQIKFLPWPYSIISVLGLGLILLVAGASFVNKKI
jgi:hypothetical protein